MARLILLCTVAMLSACNPQTKTPVQPLVAPTAEIAADCADEPGLSYICGFQAPEDLLPLGSTGLLLASGQRRPPAITTGHIYLIDPVARTQSELVHAASFLQKHDITLFPDCPGPLNLQAFAVHGISVTETAAGIFSIYSVSHGEREAIEVYDLDMHDTAPVLTWKGCVVLSQDAYFNGVARLADGGFLATRMRDANQNPSAVVAGAITGSVFEWHPGGTASPIAGTELSFPNGIDISQDERYVYVTAGGTREVVRFDLGSTPISKISVTLPIAPDNIHWGRNGMLLTAGNNYVAPEMCSGNGCTTGWSVLEVNAESLAFTRLGGADQTAAIQNVSAAVQIDDDVWATTFNGNRIARFSR